MDTFVVKILNWLTRVLKDSCTDGICTKSQIKVKEQNGNQLFAGSASLRVQSSVCQVLDSM